MLEILLFLYRASRAQTPLFFGNTDAFGGISETKRYLFVTTYKTWAHPANTEPDTSFPVHDKILQGFNCFPATYKMSPFEEETGWSKNQL
jgi:hypothetical protein